MNDGRLGRERDSRICWPQGIDHEVGDGDPAGQQPRGVADGVRLQPGVEYAILDLRGVVGEGVLTSEVAVVPPVEYRGLGVHQGDLRLVGPVAVTAIHGYLEGQVVQQGPRSEVHEQISVCHGAICRVGSNCIQADPAGVVAAACAPSPRSRSAVLRKVLETGGRHGRPR